MLQLILPGNKLETVSNPKFCISCHHLVAILLQGGVNLVTMLFAML